MTEREYIVGVDLGGTNVRAAVSSRDGKILGDAREPSYAMGGFDETVAQILKAAKGAMLSAGVSTSQVIGVGMGVPGTIKPKEGLVLWTPNFSEDWRGANVVAPMEKDLGVPTYIGNDANVAALGEYWFGAGKGVSSLFMFTLGTGIGTGFVIDGKLWIGASGGAAEFGHQVIMTDGPLCGCGKPGCLEALAGQAGIVERAQRKLRLGRESLLLEMTGGDFEALTPAMMAEAAEKGDKVSLKALAETGYYIGIGVSNIIVGLSPEMVVIGGGVSRAGEVLWGPMTRTIRANTLPHFLEACKITASELGDDVGIMGGVGLVMEAARR